MPNDHFVAQTYLRNFAGPTGMLRGYSKKTGESFPCWPRNVCAELDGDIIPDFLSAPEFLGKYRKAFESEWNGAISALQKRTPTDLDKFHIAGYWANLLVCTPAWRRLGVEHYTSNTLQTLRAEAARPGADPKLSEGLEALEQGKLALEVEPDYIRAQNAKNVVNYAWGLYNADWSVFENDTEIEFITSDNPASFADQGPWRGGQQPFLRFLPVTPRLCLMCDLSEKARKLGKGEPDFLQPPQGAIRGGLADQALVNRINIATAQCAEQLILASHDNPYAADLAQTYAKFRIRHETLVIGSPRGAIIGSYVRVSAGKK